jgi:hypothetical protein
MKYVIIVVLATFPFFGVAQEVGDIHHKELDHQEHSFKRFKVIFAFAQSYIPPYHLHEESESSQLIPTDGIELQYFFSHKFFVKWTNEVEFLTYSLKDSKGEHYVRDNAFLTMLTLGYEFYDNFAFFAGAGYEFEKSKNLWVCRFGLEYTFKINENWEISPELLYDVKKDSHTAFTWGVGFGYRF